MGRVREHGATRGVDRALVAAVLAGMALATGLSVNLMLQVPLTGWLLFASGVALVAALPGVLRPWLAIASPFLAALGLYVLWRILLPPPEPPADLLTTTTAVEGAHGLGGYLSYYGQQLHLGLSAYREDLIPLTLDGAPQLRLLVVTVWYVMAWVCLWIGISLRRPVWGAAVLAGVLAVWVAMQSEKRGVWSVLVFLVLMALLLGATRRTGVESRAGSRAPAFGRQAAAAPVTWPPPSVAAGWDSARCCWLSAAGRWLQAWPCRCCSCSQAWLARECPPWWPGIPCARLRDHGSCSTGDRTIRNS